MNERPPIRTWQDIIIHLMDRYEKMLGEHHEVITARLGTELHQRTAQLCRHALLSVHELTEDKANRWLGFVQGILVSARVLDIEAERDYTRPLFHAIKGHSRSHDARHCRLD